MLHRNRTVAISPGLACTASESLTIRKAMTRQTRRQFLASAALTLVATSLPGSTLGQDDEIGAALAQIMADGPFTRATVVDIARTLAKADFRPPPTELPDPIKDLTYEQYRDIQFNRDASIWTNEGLPFRLQLFHRGFYYKEEIDIAVVADGTAQHLPYNPNLFIVGDRVPKPMPSEDIGFAGLRLLGNINDPARFDEVAVFLGASYFRSLGQGEVYGISARGLALKTADPEGEEFPLFRAFWVERPLADSDAVVVHALLDSQSATGAYRFTIRPGASTAIDVEATLFPRVDLTKVGLAPASSMFAFGPGDRLGVDDYRPEVHDSDGLLMISGRGERIWRPLTNPKMLQVSAFVDAAPRGFGLMQRNRDAAAYQDFEATYERRPSLWIEPVGDWGQGAVTLIEIPSDSEINDNMVSYWQPKEPIKGGSEFSFAYRQYWGGEPAVARGSATITATRIGRATLQGDSPVRLCVVDYQGSEPAAADAPLPTATVSNSAGAVSETTIQRNPLTGGWRLTFKLDPQDAETVELRAVVTIEGVPAETWLYRWTA
jgi:glucans biosynthesis protein